MAYLCRDSDRRFLFRGWNRLCLYAASLDVVGEVCPDAAGSTASSTRAEIAEVEDSEAMTAVDEPTASKHVVSAVSAARGKTTERGVHHDATVRSEESEGLAPAEEEEERARRNRRNRVLGLVVRYGISRAIVIVASSSIYLQKTRSIFQTAFVLLASIDYYPGHPVICPPVFMTKDIIAGYRTTRNSCVCRSSFQILAVAVPGPFYGTTTTGTGKKATLGPPPSPCDVSKSSSPSHRAR